MKKTLLMSVILTTVLVITAVLISAGCSSTTSTATPTTTSTPSPKPAQTQAVYNWRMPTTQTEAERWWKSVGGVFADQVRNMSSGRINITPLPSGVVVPIQEAWQAVKAGTIEMCAAGGDYHVGITPASYYEGGWPLMFLDSAEQIIFWEDYGYRNFLNNEVYASHNTYVLGHNFYSGVTIWTKRPAKTLEELKTMKLRIAGSPAKVLGSLGIPTVSMTFT